MSEKARQRGGFGGILRAHGRWFAAWLGAGAALRAFFILRYPVVEGDSFIYGDIAKNWLHGVYGLSTAAGVAPTYIRLPGYPAFLAVIFKIFGMENYTAALWAQMAVELATCFVIALLAWELVNRPQEEGTTTTQAGGQAAKVGFALAAICPFTANYVATPLTETLAIFLTAVALYVAARALRSAQKQNWWWLACGLVIGGSIMVRPDDGILLIAVGGWLGWHGFEGRAWRRSLSHGLALCAGVALFVAPWSWRNLRTMHRFQPLAPFHANDPGEFVAQGFNHWLGTWVLDTISVYDISFEVPGEPMDAARLPARALGDAVERRETEGLIAAYNRDQRMTPALDTEFGALARRRIREYPFRYYVALPLGRLADMWLRPRTELLPIGMDWWNFGEHPADSAFAVAWAALNLLLLILALVAVVLRRRKMNGGLLALMIAFVVLRCALLITLANPETRYTLECFPVVLALGAVAIAALSSSLSFRAQRRTPIN